MNAGSMGIDMDRHEWLGQAYRSNGSEDFEGMRWEKALGKKGLRSNGG